MRPPCKVNWSDTLIAVNLLFITCPLCVGICPTSCTCNDNTLTARCVHAQLEIIPITFNPGIKCLYLNNNRIKTISYVLSFYGDLEILDLSQNEILSIVNMSLQHQKMLQELTVSNNKLSSLHHQSFMGLVALKSLDLSHNFLDEITPNTFKGLQSLRTLILKGNRIHNIKSDSFSGLSSLWVLNLRDNNLLTITGDMFKDMTSLKDLDISANPIIHLKLRNKAPSSLPQPLFSQNSDDDSDTRMPVKFDARRLTVDHTVRLTNDPTLSLMALKVLRLQENGFKNVPTDQLSSLSSLEEVYLGGNEFEELPSNCLQGLSFLRVIEISNVLSLEVIRSHAFDSNPHLETVIINQNHRLKALEKDAFTGLKSLVSLTLRGNGFETFSAADFPLASLQSLDLTSNPLVCNCSLLWLKQLTESPNRTVHLTPVLCHAPSKLSGHQLTSLTSDDLSCDSLIKTILFTCILAVGLLGLVLAFGCVIYRHNRRLKAVFRDKLSDRAVASWPIPEIPRTSWREAEYPFTEETFVYRTRDGIKAIPVSPMHSFSQIRTTIGTPHRATVYTETLSRLPP